MQLVSSNFREILPDRITPLTASLLMVDFERAMVTQYAMYGWPLRTDLGPCVAVLRGKPYFNYGVLRDIMVNCWSGRESSLVRYLGIQGRFESSTPQRGRLPPLHRALRAVRLGRRASRSQENSELAYTDTSGDIVKQMEAARAGFSAALLNHLLVGTASAIVYEFTESLFRLLSRGPKRISVHELRSRYIETASGLQQQAFRRLVAQWRSIEDGSATEQVKLAFDSSFDTYLRQFGHRCAYELELATPRIGERPEALMDEIHKLADRVRPELPPVGSYGERVMLRLASVLSRPARRWMVRREMSKSALARKAAALRTCFLLAGRQLTGRGLTRQEDVFRYTAHEIMEALVLSSSLGARGAQQDGLPEYLDTMHWQSVRESESCQTRPVVLEGIAVSKGTVIGGVRKVHGPDDVSDLAVDSILVVRALDSGWTAALLQARGVVTEVGGVLSHAAIVAREHGIPAVFNVTSAMTLLSDGMRVELDGSSGRIRILSDERGDCESGR